MVPSRWIAVVRLAASACSPIFVRPPPDSIAIGEVIDCTESRVAPTVDGAIAALARGHHLALPRRDPSPHRRRRGAGSGPVVRPGRRGVEEEVRDDYWILTRKVKQP
jgi:hypothetical protein